MKGVLLRFYVHENRKHGHVLMYEWLLERARAMGIQGGSAFRAIAGYGRHGVVHEERFFELAGDLTVAIDFAVGEPEADALLDLLAREGVELFHVRMPIEFAAPRPHGG